MSSYTSNRDGGKTNEEGHYRFHVKAWTGNVLSGLQAQAKSPLALGVDITTGDVKVDYSGYGYTAWTDAIESVTLTTADPSNPRIDRIVGYIDRGVTPSSAVTNNPGILKFLAVAGTPAGSPSAPNDAAVQTSVGASNPWFSIANVLVGTGVTTISSGNITDTRVLITVPANGVNSTSLATNAVTGSKLATDAITLGYAHRTTDFTTTSTSESDITSLSTTVTVPAGGRRVEVTVYIPWIEHTVSNANMVVAIYDGATGIGGSHGNFAGANLRNQRTTMAVHVPTAGSHTYKATIAPSGTAGTTKVAAGTTYPAFIIVKLV